MHSPLSLAHRRAAISLRGALLSTVLLAPAGAAATQGGFHENLRVSLDVSSRVVSFQVANQLGKVNVVGLDMHKVFSSPNGDIGTLVLQGYKTYLDNQVKHPPFFAHEDDSRLVYRIFNFNYTALGARLPNIRLGHFEIPYGLEQTISTNGTLRDYSHGPNLGVKADWGISLNKEMQNFEYELSVTSGGGQEVDRVNGSYVYAARLGTPRDDNLVLGISALNAKTGSVSRQRLALDSQYYLGAYGIFAQLDRGKDASQQINHGILEFNWRNSNESCFLYIQNFYFSIKEANDTVHASNAAIGIRLEPDRHWDMSAKIKQEIDTFANGEKDTLISAQLRYRF